MTAQHTCLACGHQSRDVAMCLVEIVPAERRMVEVRIPVTHRDGSVEIIQTVPELFGHEPRCRDKAACRERMAEMELTALAAQPVQAPAESPADAAETWRHVA